MGRWRIAEADDIWKGGRPSTRTMDLDSITEQRPTAGNLVEPAGSFFLLDVSTSRVQGHAASLAPQHQYGVGSAGDYRCAPAAFRPDRVRRP